MPSQPPSLRVATQPAAVNLSAADLTLTDIVAVINGGTLSAQTTLGQLQTFLLNLSPTPVIDLEVTYADSRNVQLPNPILPFSPDGVTAGDGDSILLLGQANPVENGPYLYNSAANLLTRSPLVPTGAVLNQPYNIHVNFGDTYDDTVWGLIEATVTIGTDHNTWLLAPLATGQQPNTGFFGPALPFRQPAAALWRPGTPMDTPVYRPAREITTLPNSIYVNLNNFGFISHFISPSNPWIQRDMIGAMAKDWNTIVFDQACYLANQITANLSGKLFVFTGEGYSGANKVIITANTGFLDISGSTDFRMEGQCVVEYLDPPAATTKAIKATASFSNFQMESLLTRGAPFALSISTAHGGFNIGSIGVYDYPTEVPWAVTGAGFDKAVLGRLINLPQWGVITATSNAVIKPNINSPFLDDTAVLGADKTLTLSTDDVTYNSRFYIKRTGGGAFNLLVTDGGNGGGTIATLATGRWCQCGFDPVAGAWKQFAGGALL